MPRKSLSEINKESQEKVHISACRRNEVGIITDVMLSDGRKLTKEEAINVCKEEGIAGVNVGRTRGEGHQEILRANPTNDPAKALCNLPSF